MQICRLNFKDEGNVDHVTDLLSGSFKLFRVIKMKSAVSQNGISCSKLAFILRHLLVLADILD